MSWANFLELGVVDHETVDASVRKKLKQSRGSCKTYSDKDHFLIGKDASIYGPSSGNTKWKKNLSKPE